MSGKRHLFTDITSCPCPSVSIANGDSCPVTGQGTISLSPDITLYDMLFVLSFPVNLLSISKIVKQLHCSVHFLIISVCFRTGRLDGRLVWAVTTAMECMCLF